MTAERSVSGWDDYPVHQTSEFIRHVATSDRNFYDRYYFNLHPSSDEYFAIFGLGQYPNLGTTDAFLAVTKDGTQRIMRTSKPLEDRMDISVGPMRVEIIEPLEKLRVIVEPNDADIAMDVTWTASIPAFEEPRQYLRSRGTVVFDTQRFAQLGRWEGTLTVAGEDIAVTPDRCGGSRDRSWGVRLSARSSPTASGSRSRSCRACGTTCRSISATTRSSTCATSAPTGFVPSKRPSALGPTQNGQSSGSELPSGITT